MSDAANTYDASHIQVLEGLEAIRKRPGMYVGSISERGLHQMVFDVAYRAVNEVLAGRASAVDVTLTPDGGVRVADDGPGIPVEAAGDTGGPGLETLLTSMHPGAEPGGRHAVATSLFGVGPCVTNALSSRMTAEVRSKGVHWVQDYARGVALTPPTVAGPTTRSGTTIAFWPDTDIFGTAECSFVVLSERFRELAFLNRGLDIALTDERPPGGSRSVRHSFPGGARDLVAFLDAQAGAPVHPQVIGFEREEPRMAGTVEVALRWHVSREERLQGYANSEPTPYGGRHMEGFRDGVAAAVNAHARERRLLAEAGPDLSIDEICEGLTAVVSVKLDRPQFSGSTHGVLDGGAPVRAVVAEAVREYLDTWVEGHPEHAAAIVNRIIQGARRD
ncbi:DNA gyrase subunit B [Streptomyces sp. NPDC016562]|uniref:DNA gyrase subunit B n=1 Tax=Streptomyces sp. NPDC016562 TaxID=3364966 RepID=UPI0036F901B2